VLNGRVVWVLDAYTTSNEYPYSQSLHASDLPDGSGLNIDLNYVRNSVKATVDAYDGTVKFYVVDTKDPIVKAYRKAFPGLFTDASKMPAGLKSHWRYPEDIFRVQTEQYTQYHMTDPSEFFRKQDLWDIAQSPNVSATAAAVTGVTPTTARGNNGGRNSTLAASGDPINPLYLTMQLPGKDGAGGQEFVLMRSFTPRKKANLASFVVARNDPAHYGQIVLYQTNDSTALSPAQAASSIESDQFISAQFTLLNQQQSTVKRGDVQLIPIGDTIMYVRPIWVEGEGSQTFPHFRFVAAAVGDRAVLGANVSDAVNALLNNTTTSLQLQSGNSNAGDNGSNNGNNNGSTTTTTPTTTPTTAPSTGGLTVDQLIAKADSELTAADAALASQNLGAYQTHVKNAEAYLAQAQRQAASSAPAPTTPTTATHT
jgi:hypothetical protein